MSVVATPSKKEIAMQKDIFRLAAAIYSETNSSVAEPETQLEIIKCMYAATGNDYLTKNEIISEVLSLYKYHITEDELVSLIKHTRGVFQSVKRDEEDAYQLTQSALIECEDSQKNNIDSFIDAYIEQENISDPQRCKDAIHVYLYELTTTNIYSYQILLTGKDGTQFTSEELSVDVSTLNDDETQLVHKFLLWDNPRKNIALGNLVYCCLEYCLLINGDSPNRLLKDFIKRREIYLDTNVIFRALGINGDARKKVVLAFLNKCKQAKLKLIIAHTTKQEFFDTITHYISQMVSFPSGNIYEGAYEELTDYNIFSFYEKWKSSHKSLSLNYFKGVIEGLYKDLLDTYKIEDDKKMPRSVYDSDEFKEVRNRYSASIKHTKQEVRNRYAEYDNDERYYMSDSHDATMVRYIELLREKYDSYKNIFLVSSDKILRLWDMNRPDNPYPIVIYPSQLFLILLKTCGRSENDYDSFVNFINIRPYSKQISPETAHIILSGISSITEDIKTQKHLVAAVYDDKFQDVIQHSTSDDDLYQVVQQISQNYLDEELKEKQEKIKFLEESAEIKVSENENLQRQVIERDAEIATHAKTIAQKNAELDAKQKQIEQFVDSKVRPLFIWKNYICPICICLLALLFLTFVGLQFFYKDKPWNFAIGFFDWMKSTPFGTSVGDFVYVVDGVFFAMLSYAWKKWMTNPFNKKKARQIKLKLVQNYIENNHLS